MKYFKYICLLLLILFSLMSVKSSIEAKSGALSFSFSNEASCQLKIYQSQLIGSFKNIPHLKGFFVMSLLGLIGFSRKEYFKTGFFVGSLTLITELLQMWSPSRNCRLTDLIPNVMGFALAVTVVIIFTRFKEPFLKIKKTLK
jgi:VanZ family protein